MNKNTKDTFFLFIGILGGIVVLCSITRQLDLMYYLAGTFLFLLTAIYYRLTYFIALELILMSGHGAKLLGISPVLQLVLPILLCVQLFIYYLLSGQLKNVFLLIGIIGIALLPIGFSYTNQWVFLFGSVAIATFALYTAYTGRKIALLWAFFNLFLIGTAVFKLIGDIHG